MKTPMKNALTDLAESSKCLVIFAGVIIATLLIGGLLCVGYCEQPQGTWSHANSDA